mmetsp:Transcript_18566/g.27205  ORF Transcript_18566/g.27205 Transcript_18566/m.27205 type:complete len:95 (-) Transcript_18566:1437-1721(-)
MINFVHMYAPPHPTDEEIVRIHKVEIELQAAIYPAQISAWSKIDFKYVFFFKGFQCISMFLSRCLWKVKCQDGPKSAYFSTRKNMLSYSNFGFE